MKSCILTIFLALSISSYAQKSINDLAFLVGTWEVREDNLEKNWWEKSTRIVQFTLDSTYIQLDSEAITSSGKKRVYRWFIHYNSKEEQFEMISIFSNWHKIQFDILEWDENQRTLIIKNKPHSEEYHERFGELVFNQNLTEYIWKGVNKNGDPNDPDIWRYTEVGSRKID